MLLVAREQPHVFCRCACSCSTCFPKCSSGVLDSLVSWNTLCMSRISVVLSYMLQLSSCNSWVAIFYCNDGDRGSSGSSTLLPFPFSFCTLSLTRDFTLSWGFQVLMCFLALDWLPSHCKNDLAFVCSWIKCAISQMSFFLMLCEPTGFAFCHWRENTILDHLLLPCGDGEPLQDMPIGDDESNQCAVHH